jgi:hypothetical protein
MTVAGAVYRPLAGGASHEVELALCWRAEDDRPVLLRVLEIARRELGAGSPALAF